MIAWCYGDEYVIFTVLQHILQDIVVAFTLIYTYALDIYLFWGKLCTEYRKIGRNLFGIVCSIYTSKPQHMIFRGGGVERLLSEMLQFTLFYI